MLYDRYLYGTAYRQNGLCPELCKPCHGLMQIATESYDAENAAAAGDQFALIVELSTGVESNSVVAWSSTPEMTSPFLGLLGNLWKPTRRQGHSEDPTQQ